MVPCLRASSPFKRTARSHARAARNRRHELKNQKCGCVRAARTVSPNWSPETMTCHSSHCFSIVWSQGNAPLVTSLPSSCYMTPKMARQTSRLTSSDRSMLKLQIVRTFPCRSLRGSLSKASRQVGGWEGSVKRTVTDSRFSRKGLNVNCSGSRLTGVTLPKHLVYTNKKD